MASAIAMMVMGAIVNATAFTGSMVLAKTLGGDSSHTDAEKERHDKALEAYQQAMGAYQKQRQMYQDWLSKNYTDKKEADEIFNTTDRGFLLYKKAHPDNDFKREEPQFNDYYKPTAKQKKYEMVYIGGSMLGAGWLVSKFLS